MPEEKFPGEGSDALLHDVGRWVLSFRFGLALSFTDGRSSALEIFAVPEVFVDQTVPPLPSKITKSPFTSIVIIPEESASGVSLFATMSKFACNRG
ncbi:hypothetical protein AAC387_Pa07g0563 [Persea americana]